MAEWRIGRRWSDEELEERLAALAGLERNFAGSPGAPSNIPLEHPTWGVHRSRARVGTAAPGPPKPDGPFARGRDAMIQYAFSDPGIVEAHFDPLAPLLGRRMLLELKVGPLLRYLCGVLVADVRDETTDAGSVYGFRYDTLDGHIEAGCEWFLLEKDHGTGELTLEIEATWRTAEFPNWWSRLGFELVGRRYQRRWHVQAHRRMAAYIAGQPGSASSLPPSLSR